MCDPDMTTEQLLREVADLRRQLAEARAVEATHAQAEEALRQSEERYRDLFENANDLIQSVDPEGRFLYVNRTWLETLGYEEHELPGLTIADILRADQLPHCMEIFGVVAGGTPVSHVETVFVARDGREIPVEGNANAHFEGGRFMATRGIFRDITKRRRMEQELIRFERLRALGEMSAGVSHNLNNMLVGVLGFAELIQMGTRESRTRADAEQIVASALRAKELVQRLYRAVHRGEERELEPISVNEVVREAVETAQPRWKDETEAGGVTVEVATDLEDVPLIRGARAELHDVVMNLLFNAVDAMPLGGTITLQTRALGQGVQMTVSDPGIGMEEATSKRVFEPFFTTKMDVGTGLGLFTVYNTTARWGGRIDVDSAPGEGTSLTLWFPAWVGPEKTPSREAGAASYLTGRGRIAIVEDDEATCQLLSRLLSPHHDVDVYANGREALAVFAPNRYDVILIDLGMPGMPGDEVARLMHEADGAVASVLITGWPLADDDPRLAPFDLHVLKPFRDLGEVRNLVARALVLHQARAEQRGRGPFRAGP